MHLFDEHTLDRALIHTKDNLPVGLSAVTPLVPSIDVDPAVSMLIGFDEVAHPSDAPPFGCVRGCNVAVEYGHCRYDTSTIEIDRVMREVNQGSLEYIQAIQAIPGVESTESSLSNLSKSDALGLCTMVEMKGAGLLMQRKIDRQIWQGNPAISREMTGLDRQVTTGIVDADTGLPVPALDPDVEDFRFDDVAGSGRDIIEYLSMMHWYLEHRARHSKLTPVQWVIAMRPSLWYELSAMWGRYLPNLPNRDKVLVPASWECRYCGGNRGADLTACVGGCGASREPVYGQYVCLSCGRVYSDSQTLCWDTDTGTGCGAIGLSRVEDVDGFNQVIEGRADFRDWMRRERKIPINGCMLDVVLDEGIAELSIQDSEYLDHGQFASSIYILPVTVCGGMPVLFREYLNYRDPIVQGIDKNEFWTDNGVYHWRLYQNRWDYRLTMSTRQRVVLRTPQLAGVVRNVGYSLLQHVGEVQSIYTIRPGRYNEFIEAGRVVEQCT